MTLESPGSRVPMAPAFHFRGVPVYADDAKAVTAQWILCGSCRGVFTIPEWLEHSHR